MAIDRDEVYHKKHKNGFFIYVGNQAVITIITFLDREKIPRASIMPHEITMLTKKELKDFKLALDMAEGILERVGVNWRTNNENHS